MAVNPFLFVSAINKSKEDIFETQGYRDNDYVGFIVNRVFSNFQDTIFIANECNYRLTGAPGHSQFQFYLNMVEKGNRFRKMAKNTKDEKIEILMKRYKMSRDKATEVVDLIPDSRYAELNKIMNDKGGRG